MYMSCMLYKIDLVYLYLHIYVMKIYICYINVPKHAIGARIKRSSAIGANAIGAKIKGARYNRS